MKKSLFLIALGCLALGAAAKIPAPQLDDAAKAKAAETAAKAQWQAKIDAFQLCKSQDKIAAKYGKGGAKMVQTAAKPGAAAAAAPAKGASGATPASAAASGTPAVASNPPPCNDPGPFAYNAPEQKPLETSGAHSPAGTAASPPSVKQEAAQIQASGKTAAGAASAAKK
jgi:hypothetical protein